MPGERPPTLFDQGRLSDLIENGDALLSKEIGGLDENKILKTSVSDLAEYFGKRFYLDVPTLKLDEAHTLPPEQIAVEQPYRRDMDFREDRPYYVKATVFTLCVPFDGDPDLFKYLPSSFYLNHVFGEIEDHTVVLRQQLIEYDKDSVRRGFDEQLRPIQEYLEKQRGQVAAWNRALPGKVTALLDARKAKALKAFDVAESLGYPLKRRDTPTYPVPVTRKPLILQMPQASPGPYIPEPALEARQYEDIIEMISSLAIAMERSPSTFATMTEEQLRDQLLVILNSNFEGRATGETFNKGGKTDILIRERDRNVFIAECKVWDGPKTLSGAIDQLLGYACWRDTKVAVILFNRRKDFSAVLSAVPETVASHPQCKRRLDYKAETRFRFLFGQKGDANRELTLTVPAFDIPGAETLAADPVVEMAPRDDAARTQPPVAPAAAAPRRVQPARRAPSPARRRPR
jgi:hypothetical protein